LLDRALVNGQGRERALTLPYQVEFTPAARRQFRKLPAEAQRRLAPVIDGLADNPRPAGSKKLVGPSDLWRVRAGDFRVIYTIQDERLIVQVVRVGNRREVYEYR